MGRTHELHKALYKAIDRYNRMRPLHDDPISISFLRFSDEECKNDAIRSSVRRLFTHVADYAFVSLEEAEAERKSAHYVTLLSRHYLDRLSIVQIGKEIGLSQKQLGPISYGLYRDFIIEMASFIQDNRKMAISDLRNIQQARRLFTN